MATQLESIARFRSRTLSAAILKADIPEAGRKPFWGVSSLLVLSAGRMWCCPINFRRFADAVYPERSGTGDGDPAFSELLVQISPADLLPGEASQPAADSLSGAADRPRRPTKFVMSVPFYVSDCLLLLVLILTVYYMVYQPSDRPSAARWLVSSMMLRRRTGSGTS